MQTLPRNINPFALMLDPQAVIAQIERSERLEGLHRRVCRPLDKPLLGGTAEEAGEGAEPPSAMADANDDLGQADEAAAAEQHTDRQLDALSGSFTRHD